MALFDPGGTLSVEVATALEVAALLSELPAWQALCEQVTDAAALEKIIIGPFPEAWENGEYTKEQLATLFCTAHLHSPTEPEKIVQPDASSFTQPNEQGTFVLTIRRFGRESEIQDINGRNDLYTYFWNQTTLLETQFVTATTDCSRTCPVDMRIMREVGPVWGQLAEEIAQGAYLWSQYKLFWGIEQE